MSSYSVADLLTPTESTTSDKRSEDHCDDVENGEPGSVALLSVLELFYRQQSDARCRNAERRDSRIALATATGGDDVHGNAAATTNATK